jgi:hypothetical protein
LLRPSPRKKVSVSRLAVPLPMATASTRYSVQIFPDLVGVRGGLRAAVVRIR